MSDVFFGMDISTDSTNKEDKKSNKTEKPKKIASTSLNFGNVSKELNFNNSKEGYFQVRPKALISSSHNPRPDWDLDDDWLVKHVAVDMDDIFENNMESKCLVKIEEKVNGDDVKEVAIYPSFDELINTPSESHRKQYEFLVELSKSIREKGQIQPIEIESDPEGKVLCVLEGHLRRLACILGRIPFIKAIRNEDLGGLTKQEKIERQITENSLRTNLSPWGIYQLSNEILSGNPKLSARELGSKLNINKNAANAIKKLIFEKNKFSKKLVKALQDDLLSLRELVNITSESSIDRQEQLLEKKKEGTSGDKVAPKINKSVLARGRDGRKKSVATLKIKNRENCIKAGSRLLQEIPALAEYSNVRSVTTVDDLISLFKSLEEYLLKN